MDKKLLVVNPGSASKKYGVYVGGREALLAHFESTESGYLATYTQANEKKQTEISEADYQGALKRLVEYAREVGLIEKGDSPDCFGLRIVAPGSFFQENKVISEEYYQKLLTAREFSPLHLNAALGEFEFIRETYTDRPVVGISDSAFHKTLPDFARTYGIDSTTAYELEIYRFGYHGISVGSVIRQLSEKFYPLPPRIVVCHLGGGASVTAVAGGKSVRTSMGMTPMEGLVMNSRVGDFDSGALLYLMKKNSLSANDLENELNKNSGLLGVSESSGDVRVLLEKEAKGDQLARLALDVFCYKAREHIGASVAAMNGIDMLVFSATIGERSWPIRARVCENLDFLAICLDDGKNKGVESGFGMIEKEGALVKIAVVPTDEMGEMAIIAREVVKD